MSLIMNWVTFNEPNNESSNEPRPDNGLFTVNSLAAWRSQRRVKFYTQRNISRILLSQTDIRLYLPFFTIYFGTANGLRPFAVSNQSRKMVNTI